MLVEALGRRRLLRLDHIREIVPFMDFEVAGASGEAFKGMLQLRGEIVPIYEMAAVETRFSPDRCIVVVNLPDLVAGLIVDEVLDVLEVGDEQLHLKPGAESWWARIGDGAEESIVPVLEPAELVKG